MTTFEQLKEIIVKAVPEIMELKVGCKITGKEILGRDINLEDVLATLDKASRFIFIGVTGKIYRDNYGELVNTDVFWQLGKPLHLQSEEMQLFLLQLLNQPKQ